MDSFKHKQFIITLLFLKHIYRCVVKREENIKECEIYLPDINEQGLVLNWCILWTIIARNSFSWTKPFLAFGRVCLIVLAYMLISCYTIVINCLQGINCFPTYRHVQLYTSVSICHLLLDTENSLGKWKSFFPQLTQM